MKPNPRPNVKYDPTSFQSKPFYGEKYFGQWFHFDNDAFERMGMVAMFSPNIKKVKLLEVIIESDEYHEYVFEDEFGIEDYIPSEYLSAFRPFTESSEEKAERVKKEVDEILSGTESLVKIKKHYFRFKTEKEFIRDYGKEWRTERLPVFSTRMDSLFGKEINDRSFENAGLFHDLIHHHIQFAPLNKSYSNEVYYVSMWMLTDQPLQPSECIFKKGDIVEFIPGYPREHFFFDKTIIKMCVNRVNDDYLNVYVSYMSRYGTQGTVTTSIRKSALQLKSTQSTYNHSLTINQSKNNSHEQFEKQSEKESLLSRPHRSKISERTVERGIGLKSNGIKSKLGGNDRYH